MEPTSAPSGSDRYDLHEALEPPEVSCIARVEGQLSGAASRRDQDVNGTGTSGPPPSAAHGGEDPPVGARGFAIEGQGIKGGLGALQLILAPGTFFGITCGMGTGSRLSQRDRTDRHLDRKHRGNEPF